MYTDILYFYISNRIRNGKHFSIDYVDIKSPIEKLYE